MKILLLALSCLAAASRAAAGTVTGVTTLPTSVPTGAAVTVTVTGTNPCGAAHIIYGDGIAITYAITGLPTSQTHAYTNPGTYTVTARGMGNCDGEATTRVTVTGAPQPQPSPSAQITALEMLPNPARVREPVTLAIKGNGTCAFAIDFGDGNTQDVNAALPQQLRHVYPSAANYTVVVRPVPPCSGKFTEQLRIAEAGTQPRIDRVVVTPPAVNAGEPVSIAIEGTGRCGYLIDYGDGNSEARAADLPDRLRHVYPSGTYSVAVTANRPCAGAGRARLDVGVGTSTAGVSGVEATPNPVAAGTQTTIQVKGVGRCRMSIDFGDGNTADISGELPRRLVHVYPAAGSYTVEVATEPPCTAGMRTTINVRRR